MRGKVPSDSPDSDPSGITPACAGKSLRPFSQRVPTADHPRVCGEKAMITFLPSPDPGSPPRVRGKAARLTSHDLYPRITPACAGKRMKDAEGSDCGADHPRVCGEKPGSSRPTHRIAGSPPRVRGKGQRAHRQEPDAGITPACAGKRLKISRIFAIVRVYHLEKYLTGRRRGHWDHPRACWRFTSRCRPPAKTVRLPRAETRFRSLRFQDGHRTLGPQAYTS